MAVRYFFFFVPFVISWFDLWYNRRKLFQPEI
jgi:hypothetical protein